MGFLLAPLTKVARLPVAHLHSSCHVEADLGHPLAAVNFCTRSAVWTRFLTEPVAGLLTLLAVFR
jgi:aminoglycoside phosphotransferase (APT) family kinase protein